MKGKILLILSLLLIAALLASCGGAAPAEPAAPAEAPQEEAAAPEAPAEAAQEEAAASEAPAEAAEEEAAAASDQSAGADMVQAELTDGQVVIAVLNDASGVYAPLAGPNGVEAVKMAVEDFQAAHGEDALGGPIEVISADHQNKPDLANAKA